MRGKECQEGNSIYVWRIVFTVLIMILHYNSSYTKIYANPHVTNGWYIGVEFFFIVSGYLLMAKADINGKTESALRYTARRYIRLYPEYLFALVLTWLILYILLVFGYSVVTHWWVTEFVKFIKYIGQRCIYHVT